jgi:hypothetical protein
MEIKLRINILCLIGAIIAVVASILPWLNNLLSLSAGESPIDLAFSFHYSKWNGLQLTSIIFVLGAFVAFFTPLGGIVQLTGVLFFIATVNAINNEIFAIYAFNRFSIEWNIAFGIVSASISIVSMMIPLGIGFKGHSINFSDRLLTFGRINSKS